MQITAETLANAAGAPPDEYRRLWTAAADARANAEIARLELKSHMLCHGEQWLTQ